MIKKAKGEFTHEAPRVRNRIGTKSRSEECDVTSNLVARKSKQLTVVLGVALFIHDKQEWMQENFELDGGVDKRRDDFVLAGLGTTLAT